MEERPIENRPDSLGSDAVRKEKRGVGAQSAAAGAEANWVRLAARPNSNDIMYGVQDENVDLFTANWSGAGWGSGIRHDATTETDQNRNFDIVFETNPAFVGQAWLVWGNAANVSRRQWDGAAWGGITNFGDDATLVQRLMTLPEDFSLSLVLVSPEGKWREIFDANSDQIQNQNLNPQNLFLKADN